MTYVWINPVAERMTDRAALAELWKRHHLEPVYCRTDWGADVKSAYYDAAVAAEREGRTLADARCPLAAKLVRELKQELGERAAALTLAPIEPILLHCARELAQRRELQDGEKWITTPCQALARQGNALGLAGVRFLTWRALCRELGERPGRALKESPIPPGFFQNMGLRTGSVTGRERIEEFVRSGAWRGLQLAELLYCPGGCHRGDGVCVE